MPLPPHVGDDDLRARFANYGGVVGVRVFGAASPPHGYVDFSCRADAVAAAFDAHGRSLFVDSDLGRVACIVRERALSEDDGLTRANNNNNQTQGSIGVPRHTVSLGLRT